MSLAAVFIPHDATLLSGGLMTQAKGLRLYTNGREWALLPRPLPGWFPLGRMVSKDGQMDAYEETDKSGWVSECAA